MRLLVIRTSAMGDVALTTPVLIGMSGNIRILKLSCLQGPLFKPFFSSINGLRFFFPDYKKRHKGFTGLIRLYRDISKQAKIDYVIDLHDVLRSKILRSLFAISGVPVSVIDKGRKEKKSVINGRNKIWLKHSVERYGDVFAQSWFSCDSF